MTFGHGIHAGIHWRSDSDTALKLGEAVALSFLRDTAKTYNEPFTIHLTKLRRNHCHDHQSREDVKAFVVRRCSFVVRWMEVSIPSRTMQVSSADGRIFAAARSAGEEGRRLAASSGSKREEMRLRLRVVGEGGGCESVLAGIHGGTPLSNLFLGPRDFGSTMVASPMNIARVPGCASVASCK